MSININVDFNKKTGKMKALNGVCCAPYSDNKGPDQTYIEKYFKEGNIERNLLSEFNSNNTALLTLEQTKEKIASLQYIQDRLNENI